MQVNLNSHQIEVTYPSIVLPGLAAQFFGYRIVQISDLHLGTYLDARAMFAIIDLVNNQEPDIVTITGDFISYDPPRFVKDLISILNNLSPKDGTLAVLGNHDHYTDAEAVRWVLEQCNIIELRNSIHVIERDASKLYFAGIDDYLTGHSDLKKVIQQIPGDGHPAILLSHEPDVADLSAPTGKFAMQISGHSHGGQIYLPRIGNLFLPRFGRKYPAGTYKVQNMIQYTNRGLGTSWLKFRYNCPPEITVFELAGEEN